ncbi:MAG: hypothetical protein OEU92_28085 [Alphaproteobacteria bacterium]|nr:hypothetical protein [Alphaproteobacteria bacterium]
MTTDQEVARLTASLDDLNEAVAKANKRIYRLQGEKGQLASLLDQRDEQIQHLNRELGGHLPAGNVAAAAKGKTSSLRDSPTATFGSMADRIRAFFVDSPKVTNDVVASQKTAQFDKSGPALLGARRLGGSAQQTVIVLLLGLGREEIERLLPIVERDCSSRGMTPLYLIDIDAFELLRGRGSIFEYLPPADDRDRFDSSLNWDLYIQRRLALIRRKWDPVRIIAFGTSAMSTLTLWSSSPFEDTPLPAVLGDAPAPR